jgi:G3E family GTPase
MIPLVLVTGFLGSGKTTLLRHLARCYRERNIVWIVNEFSARDMDTPRLAGEATHVMAIAGGSIFCHCKITEFLNLLQSLPQQCNPDAVVVEASGVADPLVAGKMLSESGLVRDYAISAVVAVVDPGSFLKLLHTLPNIRAQIETASLVLINKTDLYPPDRIAETETAVRALNPAASIARTQHAAIQLEVFGASLSLATAGEIAPCADPHFVKLELAVPGDLDLAQLQQAVAKLGDQIYRLKGVICAQGRRLQLDYSLSGWQVQELLDPRPTGLVLIARPPFSESILSRYLTLPGKPWLGGAALQVASGLS